MNCAVIGAGAWGTALADLYARNGHDVTLWAYEADVADSINTQKENKRFLPGSRLHDKIKASNKLSHVLSGADTVTFVTPAQVLRKVAVESKSYIRDGVPVAVASKGIEADTLALMSGILEEVIPLSPVVAVSGPSFAAEVVIQQPTAMVAAARDHSSASLIQKSFEQ